MNENLNLNQSVIKKMVAKRVAKNKFADILINNSFGLIKTESAAVFCLLGISVFLLLISLYLLIPPQNTAFMPADQFDSF